MSRKQNDSGRSATDAFVTRMSQIYGWEVYPPEEKRGRPARWNWERAALAVFGSIYRGDELEPKSQAEVECLLTEWFAAEYDSEPSKSSVREHARLIWDEVRKGQ